MGRVALATPHEALWSARL